MKTTLTQLCAVLEPVIRKLDDEAIQEDTMVGFNENLSPVIGDIGSEPLIAWVRWNPTSARSFDLQTIPTEDRPKFKRSTLKLRK